VTKATSGTLDLGGKLYYETAGEGETIIFVHAGFVDSRMWDAQWGVLSQYYRVVRYDMRGYGKSDPLTAPVSGRDDLHQLMRHLNIEQAALVGCSMGGEIILDFALDHPTMVSALVAVSAVPSGFQMQGAPPPSLIDMIAAVQQGDLERASELQLRIWVDGSFRQPEQVDPAVRQRAAAMNIIALRNNTWMIANSQPASPLTPPAIQRLGALAAPTLIIAGALDHPEVLRAADMMQAGIAGAHKVIIPDAAHVPNMEKPDAFNHALLGFLRELKRA
jgi:pimeloyl-ACP methyl ester carboxylesterase